MNHQQVLEAFKSLVSYVPCCSCCCSDSGYVDAVCEAINSLGLADEDLKEIHAAAGDDFNTLAAADWSEHS